MTFTQMEEELVALRALLKEAVYHGIHNEECQVFDLLAEAKTHEEHLALEEKHCNCWLHYSILVVTEADAAELARLEQMQRSVSKLDGERCGNRDCHHSSTFHAAAGKGLCTRVNCSCSKFIPTGIANTEAA